MIISLVTGRRAHMEQGTRLHPRLRRDSAQDPERAEEELRRNRTCVVCDR